MTNQQLAHELRKLREYLVIAGYDEMHARRYLHVAEEIEELTEPVEVLRREGRLREIPGVGPSVAAYLKEYIDTGTCSKLEQWKESVPLTVVDLLRIPGIGLGTARRLFQEFGIDGLPSLKIALESGVLQRARGFGPKTISRIQNYLDRNG